MRKKTHGASHNTSRIKLRHNVDVIYFVSFYALLYGMEMFAVCHSISLGRDTDLLLLILSHFHNDIALRSNVISASNNNYCTSTMKMPPRITERRKCAIHLRQSTNRMIMTMFAHLLSYLMHFAPMFVVDIFFVYCICEIVSS